jgi:hypothetical protein
MARRIRDLTGTGRRDLHRRPRSEREAWTHLIDRAPAPRRLVIENHNPGRDVFALMRQEGWLRNVRELSLNGDLQYFDESALNFDALDDDDTVPTVGIRCLFRKAVMPKLARLHLHQLYDSATGDAMAKWSGLTHLESFELTDDYSGCLILQQFDLAYPPERLRTLQGVVLTTDADVERFLTLPRLERLAKLQISFGAAYDFQSNGLVVLLSPTVVEELVRSDRFANVTDLTLGIQEMPELKARLATVLADPAVFPRVRRIRFYGNTGNERASLSCLRRRFGLRLRAS